MIYLIIAGIVFALLVWGVRPNASFKTAGVRIVSGSISLALFAAAGFFALRGGWGKALVLLTVGAGLALSAKAPLKAQAKPQDHGDRLQCLDLDIVIASCGFMLDRKDAHGPLGPDDRDAGEAVI